MHTIVDPDGGVQFFEALGLAAARRRPDVAGAGDRVGTPICPERISRLGRPAPLKTRT